MNRYEFLEAANELEEKIDSLEFDLRRLYFDFYRSGRSGFFSWLFAFFSFLFRTSFVFRCRDGSDFFLRFTVLLDVLLLFLFLGLQCI